MAEMDLALEAQASDVLTHNEGAVLALILLRQPTTAYQIVKLHEVSPASSFNESKGSVYPIIARLKQRALVSGAQLAEDRRNAELLSCTAHGREAVRRWVLHIRPQHILLTDPLRTKAMSLTLLTRDEQIEWVVRLKALVAAKMEDVDAFSRSVVMPYNDVVHGNARISLDGRMKWLDSMLHRIVTGDN